jgi:hypothetical protein
MDNLRVILRGCLNSMDGLDSLCLPFLQEELVQVIPTHRKVVVVEEELRPLQAVRHLPVVVDQELLLQGHLEQLQVKCLVACPDILVILTLLCTLICIGNNSTWAHHTVNNSNNPFIHLDMLLEVLVKEGPEDLLDLTLINLQVSPLERQVLLPKQRRMVRMMGQKLRRSLPLKVKERLQKNQRKQKSKRRNPKRSQKKLPVHRNQFNSRRVVGLNAQPGFIICKTTCCSEGLLRI